VEPISAEDVRIAPANEASWSDVRDVFGSADAGRCQCQRFKVVGWIWRDSTQDERTAALRAQTQATETSGLIAYVDGTPAGWVAVEPRVAYPKLRTSPVPWKGREEDKDDDGVWAVTCFVVRKGFRGRGLTYHLAQATVGYARAGARGIPDAHPAGQEHHLGRTARRRLAGVRGGRVRGGRPADTAPPGDADRIR
jgi:GNAT superfamily N-acetyltransferase